MIHTECESGRLQIAGHLLALRHLPWRDANWKRGHAWICSEARQRMQPGSAERPVLGGPPRGGKLPSPAAIHMSFTTASTAQKLRRFTPMKHVSNVLIGTIYGAALPVFPVPFSWKVAGLVIRGLAQLGVV